MRISDWSSDVCSSDLILLLLKQSIDGDRGNCIGFAGLLHARPQQDRSVLNYGEHGMDGDSTAIRLAASSRRQPPAPKLDIAAASIPNPETEDHPFDHNDTITSKNAVLS